MSGYLLDTNVVLFSVLESGRLGPDLRDRMSSQARHVSMISVMEVAIKLNGGRLRLPPPFELDFSSAFNTTIAALGAELIDVELDDAARLSRLPMLHRDPFDRMIIAQAIGRGFTVVTSDRQFSQYPGLDVMEVR